MAPRSNDIRKFWKELKRRNVIQVVTLYAAISFVILQLIDIVAQPLRLPGWTMRFVIIFLCAGLIIATLFSWIYDITSGGITKTKPLKSGKTGSTSAQNKTSNAWRTVSYISILIIFVLVAFNIFNRVKSEDISKLEKSVAILPFRNDTPADSNKYFINGLIEDILNNLQAIKDLRVISRTSVEQYRNTSKSIPEIAKELGVNYIIEGSGQRSGNTIHLSVQLLRAARENHIWGKTYEQEMKTAKDIFMIQSQIAESIASELKVVITPWEKKLIEKAPTENLNAYEYYLKGSASTNYFTRKGWDDALVYFEKALGKDPGYARAYAGIGVVWLARTLYSVDPPDVAAPKAMNAISKAFELDSACSEAYNSLLNIQTLIKYDWKGAEISARKGLALSPNNADLRANYSSLLIIMGRMEEALIQAEYVLKLGPKDPAYLAQRGLVFLFAHRYDDAINAFKDAIKRNPDNLMAIGNLPEAFHQAGRYKEELEAWKAYSRSDIFKGFIHAFDEGYVRGGFSGALNLEADTLVTQSKTHYINPAEIALMYACAGNKQRTLDMLELDSEAHDLNLPFILNYPVFENLRNEPRFIKIISRMNLPYK